jgi:hypothetical protein
MFRKFPWQWFSIVAITLCLLAILFAPWPLTSDVSGDVLTFNPVADAFVSATGAANNYGGAGALEISGPEASKGEFQSVLRFDTATAKQGFDTTYGAGKWSVDSVTLKFAIANPGNPIFNSNTSPHAINVTWMENDSWVEGNGNPNGPSTTGVNWNSLATIASANDYLVGAATLTGSVAGSFETYTLSVGGNLLNDLLAGDSVSFRLSAADTGSSILYNSRSFGTPANQPVLTISATAVPEPGVAVAGGMLLISLGLRRLRKRKE